MSYLIAGGSMVLIALVLLDSFEAMLLPRRTTRHFRSLAFSTSTPGRPGRPWRGRCERASRDISS